MNNLDKLPKCGKCGYIVLGIVGTICPECGADLREVGLMRDKPSTRGSVGLRLFTWTVLVFILVFLLEPVLRGTPITNMITTMDAVALAPASGKYELRLSYETRTTEYALAPRLTRKLQGIDLTTRLDFKASRDFWTLNLDCLTGIAVDPNFQHRPRKIDAEALANCLPEEANRSPSPAEMGEAVALSRLMQICRKQPLASALSTMRNSGDWPFNELPGTKYNSVNKGPLEVITSERIVIAGCILWSLGVIGLAWRERRRRRCTMPHR